MAREYYPIWPIFDQTVEGEKEKGRKKEKKGEKESCRERISTFSLIFLTIGLAVAGGARMKVYPHRESFATRLELRSFDKLREVRVFSYFA